MPDPNLADEFFDRLTQSPEGQEVAAAIEAYTRATVREGAWWATVVRPWMLDFMAGKPVGPPPSRYPPADWQPSGAVDEPTPTRPD